MDIQVIDWQDPLWNQTLHKLQHDVYHLPAYVYLEAKRTQTIPQAFLLIDQEKIFFLPYLLRSCSDISKSSEIYDIVSPYGYGGILLSEAAVRDPGFADFGMCELKRLLQASDVCCGFLGMHPILNNRFGEIFQPGTFTKIGENVSIDLTLSADQIWTHTRKGHRSTINKCKRTGFSARMVDYTSYIDVFKSIYYQTMHRVVAADSYYFSNEYFRDLSLLGDKIHLCLVELAGEIAAACIFWENCGIVQAHLGGTKDKFLHLSPFSLLLDYARYWAKKRGNQFLHLGSGLGGAKDSLFNFKTGFSRQRHDWLKLLLITDREKYHYLAQLQAKKLNIQVDRLLQSTYFPAYRSPLNNRVLSCC